MKKATYILIIALILSSCSKKQKTKNISTQEVVKGELQAILDSAKVSGTILIFDTQKNIYYSNNFKEARIPYLPASTFKIPNSIIGLETGVLENENSVFKWNGEQHYIDAWEKDLTLKEAFQTSCVPCYQELARKIGVERMNNQLKKLQFGKMEVNQNTLDDFWLIGDSKITPFEQIDFLQRLYIQKLPIKKSTFKTVNSILKMKSNNNYTVRGKTGLAIVETIEIGWFVGYIEAGKNVVYFATKIENNNALQRNKFMKTRKEITFLALKRLNIWKT